MNHHFLQIYVRISPCHSIYVLFLILTKIFNYLIEQKSTDKLDSKKSISIEAVLVLCLLVTYAVSVIDNYNKR
jgi:hypothetical protein